MVGSAPRSTLVSAIICTRDRAPALRGALASLCAQTLDPGLFEVVVVDDGSNDDTPEVVRAFESRIPLRHCRQRRAGLASARNHGLFFARGTVALFLAEDPAEPDLLERHLAAHRRNPEPRLAVLGKMRLDPSLADDPLMRFALEAEGLPWSNPRAGPGELLDWTWFRAERSSCKRGFLAQRGIFDPRFSSGGDDVELACRLSSHGFEIVYEPDAVSRVAQPRSLDETCALMRCEGEASARLAALHDTPEVRDWTRVAVALEAWRDLRPAYESLLRSALELDRLVRTRAGASPQAEGRVRDVLHETYGVVLEASRLAGLAEAMGIDGRPLEP